MREGRVEGEEGRGKKAREREGEGRGKREGVKDFNIPWEIWTPRTGRSCG